MLASILTKAIGKTKYHVKHSCEFVDFIKKQKVPLFQSSIRKRWWTIKPHTKLTQKQFIEGVSMVFDFSYFRYGEKNFKQFFGVAMGNSISGFLADIVIEDLELQTIQKLPFRLPYYVRFVDYIKTAIPNDSEDKRMVQQLPQKTAINN